jgi:hypothetical protein
MTERVRRALGASAIYTALFVVATSVLPAPGSAQARVLLGHLFLLLPTAALVANVRAARASWGAAGVLEPPCRERRPRR